MTLATICMKFARNAKKLLSPDGPIVIHCSGKDSLGAQCAHSLSDGQRTQTAGAGQCFRFIDRSDNYANDSVSPSPDDSTAQDERPSWENGWE